MLDREHAYDYEHDVSDDAVTVKTEGQRRLIEWLDTEVDVESEPKRTQQLIATKLGINQSAVSAWRRGVSRPEPHFRDALKELCDIPPSCWENADERRLRENALARIAEPEPNGDTA